MAEKSDILAKDVNSNDMKGYVNDIVLTSTPKAEKQIKMMNSSSNTDSTFIEHDIEQDISFSKVGKAAAEMESMQKMLEHEYKQRKRAEDWAQFLERELDAHIDARKSSDERYFKLRRKLKIYKHNYHKLKEKYFEVVDNVDSDAFNISRQSSLVIRPVSVEEDVIDVTAVMDKLKEVQDDIAKKHEKDDVSEVLAAALKVDGGPVVEGGGDKLGSKKKGEVGGGDTEVKGHKDSEKREKVDEKHASGHSEVPVVCNKTSENVDGDKSSESQSGISAQSSQNCLVTPAKTDKKVKEILSKVDSSDDEDLHDKPSVPTEEEKFLNTGANRLKATPQSFEDINSAKSFWEKKYSVRPPPPREHKQPKLDFGGSLGSALDRKQFWQEKRGGAGAQQHGAAVSHMDLASTATAPHTEDTKAFWETKMAAMKMPAASHCVEEVGKLTEKKEEWEEKLVQMRVAPAPSDPAALDLDEGCIGHIQKTKLLWEEKFSHDNAHSHSGESSQRRSPELEEDLSGKIHTAKQMWEEISQSGTTSVSMSRRRSIDSDEGDLSSLSTSLDLSNRSNLDLSDESLTKIQMRKALWNEAAATGDVGAIKAAAAMESDGESGEDEDRRSPQTERKTDESAEPAPFVRVGSIKLKKEMWESNLKGGKDVGRSKREVTPEESVEEGPGNFIRAGSIRMKKELFEKGKEKAKTKEPVKVFESENHLLEVKSKWKDMESGKSKTSDSKVSRLTAEEEAILAELGVMSNDVKVESIRSVSSTKNKWEQIVTNDKSKDFEEQKKKRASLGRLTKQDFADKFSKWEKKEEKKCEGKKGENQFQTKSSSSGNVQSGRAANMGKAYSLEGSPSDSGNESSESSESGCSSDSTLDDVDEAALVPIQGNTAAQNIPSVPSASDSSSLQTQDHASVSSSSSSSPEQESAPVSNISVPDEDSSLQQTNDVHSEQDGANIVPHVDTNNVRTDETKHESVITQKPYDSSVVSESAKNKDMLDANTEPLKRHSSWKDVAESDDDSSSSSFNTSSDDSDHEISNISNVSERTSDVTTDQPGLLHKHDMEESISEQATPPLSPSPPTVCVTAPQSPLNEEESNIDPIGTDRPTSNSEPQDDDRPQSADVDSSSDEFEDALEDANKIVRQVSLVEAEDDLEFLESSSEDEECAFECDQYGNPI